jgi:hypothetical protein
VLDFIRDNEINGLKTFDSNLDGKKISRLFNAKPQELPC